jgi:hypothetical protein
VQQEDFNRQRLIHGMPRSITAMRWFDVHGRRAFRSSSTSRVLATT